MQLMLASLLGLALTVPVSAVPAQCAWNGYTQANFKGTVTKSQSILTVCDKITNPLLLNDLKSAKVTLGSDVCLYSGPSACTGNFLQITAAGDKVINFKPLYYKCGSCFTD